MVTSGKDWMESASKFGDRMMATGRKFWLIGVGAMVTAEDEACRLLDRFHAEGEKHRQSSKGLVSRAWDEAGSQAKRVGTKIEDTVGVVLNRAGVPSRNEIQTLIERVEQLTDKVETLSVERRTHAAV